MTIKQELITKIIDSIKGLDLYDCKCREKAELKIAEAMKDYNVALAINEVMAIDNCYIPYLNLFLAYKQTEGKSEGTLKQYDWAIRPMLFYINKPINKINEDDVFLYLAKIRDTGTVSSVSLDNKRRIFSAFFSWCELKGYVDRNIIKRITQIKVEKKIKEPYSDEELEKIKSQCFKEKNELKAKRDRALIELFYSTGARVSEISRLDISDIDFYNRTAIVHAKGAKDNEVYITPTAIYHLKEYLKLRKDDNEALFVSVKAPYRRLTKDGMERAIRTLGQECGISKAHPHKFRRTMATNLLNKGMPIQEVSSILNHSSLDTTMIYCQVKRESIKYNHDKFMSM